MIIMNIAVIKRKYQEMGGGGAEKYARYIVNGLINKGHRVFVLSKDFSGEKNENLIHIPVKINKLTSSSGTTAFHKGVQAILKDVVKKYNIDLTYALSRTSPVDVFRVTEQVHIEWMKLNYSSIQKYNPRHKGILDLEKDIFKKGNTKAIVTNSDLVKKLVIENYNYPMSRINVIRNGLDKENFALDHSLKLKTKLRGNLFSEECSNKIILFFISTNFHIKGLESAVKAVAQLQKNVRDKVLLVIAGGDDPKKYQRFAEKVNIQDKLLFIGSCRNPKDYYLASDLLLYPSLGEPFGNVCLEAAACGLPVITTRQNGSSEIVKNGRNGFLVENANCIDELALSVEKYYKLSASEKKDFSSKAIESAKNYDWDKHLDELEKLLISIVD
jgi:UDP-glucose:(heptosyl)LPS alpha-1,3-glucosyltransferase